MMFIEPSHTPPQPTPTRRAAEALETSFLAEMLKSAQLYQTSETVNGGSGEEQFTSFLADAHARALVERGGLGLADRIEQALLRRLEGQA